MTRSLKHPMTPGLYPGPHLVSLPVVPVRLRRGDTLGYQRNALVDTGCAFTLVTASVAAELGLDADALRSSSDVVRLQGVGRSETRAMGATVDLLLGVGPLDQRRVLPDARVYVTDAPLAGYPVLLGHHDVFERLTLSVLNHGATPYFVLRHP